MGIEKFIMKIASEYVKNNLISDQDFHKLQDVLKLGSTQDPLLFEAVIYNTIVNGFTSRTGKWIDRDWV